MNVFETMKKRRSVRTFDEVPLRPEDARSIMEFAESLKDPFGLPIEWRLLDAKRQGLSSPVIVGTDTYIAGKMRLAPRAEEAFGYAFEKVVLFACGLGVGTTWIAGTMDRAAFERAMEVGDGEVMPCVSPLGYPAKRMSLRESMMRRGIKADSRREFGELFFEGSFDRPLTRERAGRLAQAFEAVRLAPSAVNKQPWRVILCGEKAHFYEKQSRGYDNGGWDIQKIDLGIALCHFELAAKALGLSARLEFADPGVAAEAGTRYIGTIETGL